MKSYEKSFKLKIQGEWILTLVIILFLALGHIVSGQSPTNGVLPGKVHVKLIPELVSSQAQLKSRLKNGKLKVGIDALDRLNQQVGAVSMRRLIPFAEKFDERHRKYGLHQWYEISFDTSLNVHTVLKAYGGLKEVLVAEPNYEKVLLNHSAPVLYNESYKTATTKSSSATFNDPMLDEQWHYINTGQQGGTPGADINVKNIWPEFAGAPNVVVAIHDMGVDYNHEDLKNNMWVNEAELNGVEGEDDDNNGYVDDIHGFNFGDGSSNINIGFHGTHVAGTIAAENNNGIGIAGVAGGTGNNDAVKLMTLDIFGADGSNRNLPASYVYAADHGAVISQNSWGWTTPGLYEQLVHDAIDYFIAEAGNYTGSPMKGGVVIFAAGNDNSGEDYFPGAYPPVINVAALDHDDIKAEYSNFGPNIDISGPGGDNLVGTKQAVLSTFPDNQYAWSDGTSMACPHISGVAALVVSKYQDAAFTNEDLKRRLLTSYRDVDHLEMNADYKDMLGVGAIDAEVAMEVNSGQGPDAITDLKLTGIAQDFASLTWTVPADDGMKGMPNDFLVYYSTTPISVTNLEQAPMVRINNKLAPGEVFSYELQGLKPLTTYHIVVTSADRWDNRSDLSNEVTDTTNDGPVVAVAPDTIRFNIDVRANALINQSFNISNSGDGLLKWTSQARHSSNIDIYSRQASIQYPEFTTLWNSPSSIETFDVDGVDRGTSIETYAQETADDWMKHFFDNSPAMLLGETDLTKPNSLAVRFHVEQEDGFNLTDIEAGLKIYYKEEQEKLPGILEIYTGYDLKTASLTYAQEIEPHEADFVNYEKIRLEDQLFFETGQYFWIVIHIPPGPLYPLLAAQEEELHGSDHSFMSNDMGATWNLLGDLLGDDRAVWDVSAASLLKPLHKYIKLTPDKGSVEGLSTKEIQFEVDAAELINGEYTSSIAIYTNEATDTVHRVILDFTVDGHEPDLESDKVLDFGVQMLGTSKALKIEIQNTGLGAFAGESNKPELDISHPDFEYVISGSFGNIMAKRSETIEIRYTPTQVGTANGNVTLTDKQGRKYTILLYGVCVEPPELTIEPKELAYSDLTLGDEVNGSFSVKNTGNYPLDFYLPKFNKSESIDLGIYSLITTKTGYTYTLSEGSLSNPAFDWEDISQTGTEVIHQFVNDTRLKYIPIDLNFSFPFFGEEKDTIYITQWAGFLSFDTYHAIYRSSPPQYKNKFYPDSYISCLGQWTDFSDDAKGAKVYYQKFPDKIIFQWQEIETVVVFELAPEVFDYTTTKLTFQVVLMENGDIEYRIKDMGNYTMDAIHISGMLLAAESKSANDGVFISGMVREDREGILGKNPNLYPQSGFKYYIKSPGLGSVNWVSETSGTIQPGNEVLIDYKANTDNLYVGDFREIVSVVSNDPFTPSSEHVVNLNIVNGGASSLHMNVDTLDFGDVFQYGSKELVVHIDNKGGKAVGELVSATVLNNYYTVEGYLPVSLKPNNVSTYNIVIDTQELGNHDDVVTFTDGKGNTFDLFVLGKVINAPEISTDPSSFSASILYGSQLTKKLNVSNPGNHALTLSTIGEEWANIYESGVSDLSPNVDYTYQIIDDPEDRSHTWNDIDKIGSKIQFTKPFQDWDFWHKVPLPFNFNFYGVEYDSLYIGHSGIVTFSEHAEASPWGQNPFAPDSTGVNNFIAPYHAFMAFASETAGVYYHGTEDKFVITFKDLIDMFGMGDPMSVQLVLYKNGTFKFMYKFHGPNSAWSSQVGGIAYENADGTKGKQIAYWYDFINDGKTIVVTPVETYEIPANSSKEFDVVFDGTYLSGADYTGTIKLENNSTLNPEYEIPVALTIVGESDYALNPEELNLGEVMIVQEEDGSYRHYDNEFTFMNTGSQDIFVQAVMLMNAIPYGGVTMGDDNKYGTGTALDGWASISRRPVNATYRPNQAETFNLRITPKNPGEYKDTIMVRTTIPDSPIIKLPVSVTYYKAPKIGIEHDDLHVYVNSVEESELRNITLDNESGFSDLDYELSIAYERETSYAANATKNAPIVLKNSAVQNLESLSTVSLEKSFSPNTFSATEIEEYNRVLQYEDVEEVTSFIGFGGTRFYGATLFTAPEDGFNLTHVKFYYRWETVVNSSIKVQIRSYADDIHNSVVLYSETFEYSGEGDGETGSFVEFELSKNRLFYPNEKFFIELGFDEGMNVPLGTTKLEEPLPGTFFYGNGKAWGDISEAGGYEVAAFVLRACEENYQMAGWADINGSLSGTIGVGDKLEIPVLFDAQQSEQGINKATISVKTNDPLAEESELNLSLTRNRGPIFTEESLAELVLYEGLESTYRYRAEDQEGDTFTYSHESDATFVTTEVVDGDFVISFKPGYEDEGFYEAKVYAEDQYGNRTEYPLVINVIHVNRAPELVAELSELFLILEEEEPYEIDFSEYFTDADGDKVSFSVNHSNAQVADLFFTNSTTLLRPLTIGSFNLIVTASDPYMAVITHSLKVQVDHRTGIDDKEKGKTIVLYPNPTYELLNVDLANATELESIRVVGMTGEVIQELHNVKLTNVGFQINVSALPTGMYMLEVSDGQSTYIEQFIKK